MNDYFNLSKEEQKALEEKFLRDPDSFYQKEEEDRLRESMKKSYKERFLTMTRLMKIGIMLSKAKITSGNFSSSK
jgi:hypothetical protein